MAPKQQHSAPNMHVQTMPKQHNNPTLQNNAKIHHDNAPQFTTAPSVKSNHAPAIQSNHAPYVKPNKMTVQPNQPVVQSNHVQVNKTVKNFQPRHQNFHAQVNSSVASV